MSESTLERRVGELRTGSFLGKHGIRYRMGRDAYLGERYAVVFGTTNRLYDLNIDEAGREAFYRAVYEQVTKLKHPCLVPYFATGVTDGIAWIRSMHTDGVPDWVLKSFQRSKEEVAVGVGEGEETDLFFPTLASLLEQTGGWLEIRERLVILGDIGEALAYLHQQGHVAGSITEGSCFLDKTYRHSEIIAKIRYYGIPGDIGEGVEQNLRDWGQLILNLVKGAAAGVTVAKVDAKLVELAERLLGGGYPNAVDAYEDFCDSVAAVGYRRSDRAAPVETEELSANETPTVAATVSGTVGTGVGEPSTQRRRSSHRHRHHHQPKGRFLNADSNMGQMMLTIFRIMGMFVGIAVVGTAVYYGVRFFEEKNRIQQRITTMRRYSAITVLEDEEVESALSELPQWIELYTEEQLEVASKAGRVAATARWAQVTLMKGEPDAVTAREQAEAILAGQKDALAKEAKTDPITSYWYAYTQFLGLGDAIELKEIFDALTFSISQGNLDAGILYGDWYQVRHAKPTPEDDRLSMVRWRAAFGRPTRWTLTHLEAIERIVSFIRARRGFKADDEALVQLVEQAARAGYAPAVVLMSELHEQGFLVEQDESLALAWLRQIGTTQNINPEIRGEVQYRMAKKFEHGKGTPASKRAARIWYERAAKLEHREAMLALANLCERGEGTEHGASSADEARYWREKAATVEVKPAEKPVVLRLRREDLAEALKTAPEL